MRRASLVFAAALSVLVACSSESTAPTQLTEQSQDEIDLLQDMGTSTAAVFDRAGIGGSQFPDHLQLSAEQKAKIAALHEAYEASVKADIAAVHAIELEARAALKAGKSRAEIAAILAKAEPYLARIRAAFAKLQADIWNVYTPAQQAWIKGRASVCRDDGPRLTERQIQQIRALKEAFAEAIKDELEIIKAALAEARAARAAGASDAEIRRILAKAEAAMKAVHEAELRLKAAINDLLTDEQKRNPCLLRGLNA
jgi:Spy/CpxP family protein refolding chaperone